MALNRAATASAKEYGSFSLEHTKTLFNSVGISVAKFSAFILKALTEIRKTKPLDFRRNLWTLVDTLGRIRLRVHCADHHEVCPHILGLWFANNPSDLNITLRRDHSDDEGRRVPRFP